MSAGCGRIVVGLASCGISAGGEAVYEEFASLLVSHKAGEITLAKTGCLGNCHQEVVVEVETPTGRRTYGHVTPVGARRIFFEHLLAGRPVEEFAVDVEAALAGQKRIVLRNAGRIDPERLEDYLGCRGYEALRKAVTSMAPEEVRRVVSDSGLRGRGGAGFPTGRKWELAAAESGPRYVVCNADEGDPGAFMDRAVLEGDPHAVLEGLVIAGYAVGAERGFIYVRAEYPLAVRRLRLAVEQARSAGFLGASVCGSGWSFDVEVKTGAGAFVCGEETALLASVEGRRGMPRLRPPFPVRAGLWGRPTVVNNVETLANIPWILLEGAEAFAAVGTGSSKGTKVFALAGKVARPGLVEVPMGMTLREVVFGVGGGVAGGRGFKAVQLGGPSGGCLPEAALETPVDYESLKATGAMMGSGGMVVMDDRTCMVDVARFFMDFIRKESCGKCVFCRVGTTRMHETLERMTRGEAVMEDLAVLEALAERVRRGSLCGLGQTAPNPVLTTLRYFREEYEEHIRERRCRAKVCKALLTYRIVEGRCVGCTACARRCPAGCITGERGGVHRIRQEACVKCGICREVCRFDAVEVS